MLINLSIIIVNYKTPFFLLDCIESIVKNTHEVSYEIIVVDNNSMDNSEILVTDKFEEVVWINNDKNEGFGRANNIGVQHSSGEYILFLNSDTIVTESSLDLAYHFFSRDKKNGAATVTLIYEDGSNQKSVFSHNGSFVELLNYNIIYDYFFHRTKESNKIAAIHGAFFMMKRQVFDIVGGFDPDFFMYSEEFELCNRISKKGYELVCFNDIVVKHLEGKSSSTKVWNRRQRMLSLALLFRKNKGTLGLLFYYWILLFNDVTNFCFLWKMDKHYKKDYYMLIADRKVLFTHYIDVLLGRYKKPLKVKNV